MCICPVFVKPTIFFHFVCTSRTFLPHELLLFRKRFTGIFGYHMTTASDRRVILTTNERDALAVYEATGGMLTFALPQGEKLDMTVSF